MGFSLSIGVASGAGSAVMRRRQKGSREMSRRLIIVSRDDPGLYHALRADWAGDDDVAVIIDRRFAQRRQQAIATLDRRRADRRRSAPVEVLLAWRGGGATARKCDVSAALESGATRIAVRQRPGAKRVALSPERQRSNDVPEGAAHYSPISLPASMTAPAAVVGALVILLGTVSGGIVGGLALWLFLTNELATSSEPATGWQNPWKKLIRAPSRMRPPAKSQAKRSL
jgi:hypothetical protein